MMLAGVWRRHFGLVLDDPLKLHRAANRGRGIPRVDATHDWKTPGLPMTEQRVHRDKSAFRGKGVILLVRDPRDVIVSNYFQKLHRDKEFSGTLTEFLSDEVFGLRRVIEYYNTWAHNRDVPARFTVVRYEELLADTAHPLKRTLEALGVTSVADEILGAAIEECSFDNMRALETNAASGPGQLRPANSADYTTYKTRSGRSGSYLEHLDREQIDWMDRVIEDELCDAFDSYRKPPHSS